jgi:hypothetical protein
MGRLVVFIAGIIFIVGGIITLISDKNWQGALFLLAIGAGAVFFVFKGGSID